MMDLVQDSQAQNSIKMKGDLMVNALKGTLLSSFKVFSAENVSRIVQDQGQQLQRHLSII